MGSPPFYFLSSFCLQSGECLGEASKNSGGEKASSLQQHGYKCQLAYLLGCPSSICLITVNLITPNLITLNLVLATSSIPLITVDLITSNLAVPSCSLLFIVLLTLNLALATSKLFQNDQVRYNNRTNLVFLHSLSPYPGEFHSVG